MTTTVAPGAASSSTPGAGGLAWVKSREGKIVLGAGAVLVVIVLALRRGAGGGGGFVAQPQQGQPDGTIQDQLDQLTGQGGTLSELGGTLSGLAGAVDALTDRLDQDPADKPSSSTPPASSTIGRIGKLSASANRQDISWRWGPVQGATKYLVQLIQGENQVIKTTTVNDPYFRAGGGLQANRPYRVVVTPIGPGGTRGKSTTATYHTKA